MHTPLRSRRCRLLASMAICVACLPLLPAYADDAVPPLPAPVPDNQPVQQVVVTDKKSPLPDNLPNDRNSITAEKIFEDVNAMTSQETVKYIPGTAVRERFVGDRAGIIMTRTSGLNPADSLLYADDLLLSNLLGNMYSYPPRWGMVSVSEIERVDMLYGPFSALYPGNSEGGVMTLTTRMPEKAEAHLDIKAFNEAFKLYGTNQNFSGGDANASLGNKVGDWSYWMSLDHLNSFGHPTIFGTASTCTSGCGSFKVGGGGYHDVDQSNNSRFVTGASSIDHTIQDQGKVKVAYDITPDVKLTYILGLWQNSSNIGVQSYLNDSSGNPIYSSGNVKIGGTVYTMSALNPSTAKQDHMMNGVSLKSDTKGVFDYDLSVSHYTMLKDDTLAASNYGANTSGTDTRMDGTGWQTADLRGIWRPKADLGGTHEVSFGYHIDHYELDQVKYNINNWTTGSAPTSENSASYGNTITQGLYVQDAYKFLPQWTLTAGLRDEFWSAYGGTNQSTVSGKLVTNQYAKAGKANLSPKLSLAYEVIPPLTERVSVAQAYRYPTTAELYQALNTSSAIVTNNPNLKPENSIAYDWSTEYSVNRYSARLSFFEQDTKNALLQQTENVTTTTGGTVSSTTFDNIDKTRTRGIDVALQTKDVGIQGLDFTSGVTYVDAIVIKDSKNMAAVNKKLPNIAPWQAKFMADYHVNENLTVSSGLRYYSKAYSDLTNGDINDGVYGGVSSLLANDYRVSYKVGNGFTAALGVDNAFGYKAYAFHPYPQTTVFGELKFDY